MFSLLLKNHVRVRKKRIIAQKDATVTVVTALQFIFTPCHPSHLPTLTPSPLHPSCNSDKKKNVCRMVKKSYLCNVVWVYP